MKNNRRNRKLRNIRLLNLVHGETRRYFKKLMKFKSFKREWLPYIWPSKEIIEQIVETSKANCKSMGHKPL